MLQFNINFARSELDKLSPSSSSKINLPFLGVELINLSADKLINSTPKNGKLILLDEEGDNLSSSDLAKLILNWSNNNITSVNFAIGGAFGNGLKIKKTADKIIAFGKLTWPHQMVKMMIAEQIYRIETIIQGHPYHK